MQLGQLQSIESDLLELGFQIVAISPDRPENLRPTVSKNDLGFSLYSDSGLAAAKAFGIAWRVDDTTLERYQGFGIDLEEASGEGHHGLPVPAVYLFGKKGTVEFQYVNPDYRVRVSSKVVLAAAEAAVE